MTRKRSKYKPKPVIRNTVGYVMSGMVKLTQLQKENLRVRLLSRTSLENLVMGRGEYADMDILGNSCNMCTALARKYGLEYAREIRQGVDAMEAIQVRYAKWRKVQATKQELDALSLLLDIHDAQLDEVTVSDLEEAINLVLKSTAGLEPVV